MPLRDSVAIALRRGPGRVILGLGLIVILAIAGVSTLLVLQQRARELAEAGQELAAFDVLLADQTARTVEGVRLVVDDVAAHILADGPGTPEDFIQAATRSAFHGFLVNHLAGLPQLDAITIIAADGNLVAFSRSMPMPPVNVADRDYFAALRQEGAPQTFISVPVRNRATGTWNMYLARRVSGPNGEFLGLVLGAMPVDYFLKLYQTISQDGGTSIALWRSDGHQMTRYPPMPGMENVVLSRQNVLGELQAGRATLFPRLRGVDGQWRMIAADRLPGQPLVVHVSRTRSDILADWRSDVTRLAIGTVICILAICGLVLLMLRQLAVAEAMRDAVAAREEAIGARRQAEEALLRSQKLEAIGRLTAGVSHDFNNLLQAVSANLDLARRAAGRGDGERVQRLIDNASRAMARGARLTAQMLAFSRRQHLSAERLDLRRTIMDMDDLLARAAGDSVRLSVSGTRAPWPCRVDPAQFESAVLNLVINARDAMPDGGTVIVTVANVTLDANAIVDLPAGDYVRVDVGDTGTGMSPEVLAQVFEPFFTTKGAGKGSGLGLSQVHGFARQSGGTALVHSVPGQGTIVSMLFPRDMAPAERRSPASSVAAAPAGARLVLLVEDEPDVREAVQVALVEAGHHVVVAPDGARALAILRAEDGPDGTVTDMVLPGNRGGVEVAREARRLRPGVHVVLTTGLAGDVLHTDGVAGEFDVLAKPYPIRDLLHRLSRVPAPT